MISLTSGKTSKWIRLKYVGVPPSSAALHKILANLKKYSIALFLLIFTGVASGQSDRVSYLKNPGFESKQHCVYGWNVSRPHSCDSAQTHSSGSVVSVSRSELGNRKLTIRHVDSTSTNSSAYVEVVQPLKNVKNGHRYHLSAWVKSENLDGRSMVFVSAMSTDDHSARAGEIHEMVYGPSGYSAWTKVNVVFTVPQDSGELVVGLAAELSGSKCEVTRCGEVHFDNVHIRPVQDSLKLTAAQIFSNVCNDGHFLNNLTEQCQKLHKEFGVVKRPMPSNTVRIGCDAMSAATINSTIKSLGAPGGLIELAACHASLEVDVELGSNITLKGAGVGRTVLYRDPEWNDDASTLIRIRGEAHRHLNNVVMQDLTIRGSGPKDTAMNNIQIRYANNVLVERLETRNAGKSGISVRSSQKVTIRYLVAHGSVKWHGIESKDCYLHHSLDGSDKGSLVSRDECAVGIPNFYTKNIAIYSNTVFNNRGLGINSHASFAEIAGNRSFDNGSATKLTEPANNIWVHHNEYSNSSREGMKIALQKRLGDESLVPFNQVIYKNLFRRNRGYGIRIHDRAYNIYLIANQYRENDHANKLRIVKGANSGRRIKICASDQSLAYGVDGDREDHVRLEATDIKCQLDSVADIFIN